MTTHQLTVGRVGEVTEEVVVVKVAALDGEPPTVLLTRHPGVPEDEQPTAHWLGRFDPVEGTRLAAQILRAVTCCLDEPGVRDPAEPDADRPLPDFMDWLLARFPIPALEGWLRELLLAGGARVDATDESAIRELAGRPILAAAVVGWLDQVHR